MSFQLIEVTIGNKSFMKQMIGVAEQPKQHSRGAATEQKSSRATTEQKSSHRAEKQPQSRRATTEQSSLQQNHQWPELQLPLRFRLGVLLSPPTTKHRRRHWPNNHFINWEKKRDIRRLFFCQEAKLELPSHRGIISIKKVTEWSGSIKKKGVGCLRIREALTHFAFVFFEEFSSGKWTPSSS